ncbi:hypothetical protein HAHI6034_03420 [Hathewaya histolytica]|uniref:Protein containing ChW-repeats and cell-adhesion domain n=1 Tax=Hathewaya histolytica TaxID=1498 RepID=A0A4U9R2M3_HATHI|nr:hypothetical protein [Hathewaya histolytica]VTQ85532.1 protein containing ChW-repeats and cell-adhesion domain [Hathewaya histolytica]
MNNLVICKSNKKRVKPKFNGMKYTLLTFTLIIILPLFYLDKKIESENKKYNYKLGEKIYNSMAIKANRVTAYKKAIQLNNNNSANTCVYFLSEVLRMNGEKINPSICNTVEILGIMKKEGWKKEKNYTKLKPGDICFTTDESLNSNGTPSHVYIFMSWAEEGKYDYAYVCDNQAKDYRGKIYHIRNIKKTENINNYQKEPFSFFMYKK